MKFFWKRIYADAAAGLDNPGGLHTEGVRAKQKLEDARGRIAKAIGAHADEIFFTSGGTEANNLAIFGILRELLREHKNIHAITTVVEHPSVLEPLRALKRDGLSLTELSVSEEGLIDIKSLREAITEKTIFVSIQMVNSEIGTIQNIREIAKTIRHIKSSRAGAEDFLKESKSSAPALPLYFHTDAAQTPLWLPLNVEKLGVDLLTLDAQKIMGPKSVGALFVRRGTSIEPIILGGGQEKGLRSGTENVLLAGAFAAALEEAQKNVEECAEKIVGVRDFLIAEIQRLIPEALINGARGEERVANNINISIPGLDGQMGVIALDAEGVAASTRSACSSDEEELSYVLLALGLSKERAKSALRITLLPTATEADARHIAKALAVVAKRYRQ